MAQIKTPSGDVDGVYLIDPATGLPYAAGGGGGGGADRELIVTTYRAKNAFTGASIGDIITATQVIDVTAGASNIETIWRNQTTATDLAGAPSPANIELAGAQALTDAQLRASPVPVSISGVATESTIAALNAKIPGQGQATMAASSPVVIASNQSGIPTIDAPMVQAVYNQAGVIPINTDLLIIDCLNLRSLSIQCISVGTTGVITPSWSNDGINYPSNAPVTTPVGNVNNTISGANLWTTNVYARYFRLRLTTATTAGTTSLNVQGFYNPVGQPSLQNVGGSVTASVAFGSVLGTAAHSTASNGAPVRVGGRVNTAVDTTLVAGDACDAMMTTGGQQLIKPYGLPETDWQFAGAAGGIVNTTDVVLRAAGAAGVRNYCTSISVQNASGTIATEVVIKDGATVIWRGYVGTSAVLNSAVSVLFPTPLRGTAATALNVACITTGAAVYVNAQGYQAI